MVRTDVDLQVEFDHFFSVVSPFFFDGQACSCQDTQMRVQEVCVCVCVCVCVRACVCVCLCACYVQKLQSLY